MAPNDFQEENIKSLYPTFLKFVCCFENVGLDAFFIELPGYLYGENIKVFSDAVRRTLLTLKICDNLRKWKKMKRLSPSPPSSYTPLSNQNDAQNSAHTENTNTWGRKNWVFEIYNKTFFITSFAPFYPETNSRYSFGLPDCYILFQPEISFAIHDLPADTPVTNWRNPITVRDRIRKAFHEKGREYTPPLVSAQPMVYDIVKPVEHDDDPCLWWKNSS